MVEFAHRHCSGNSALRLRSTLPDVASISMLKDSNSCQFLEACRNFRVTIHCYEASGEYSAAVCCKLVDQRQGFRRGRGVCRAAKQSKTHVTNRAKPFDWSQTIADEKVKHRPIAMHCVGDALSAQSVARAPAEWMPRRRSRANVRMGKSRRLD